jgi:integrase
VTYEVTQALTPSWAAADQGDNLAVLNAIGLWADSCTLPDAGRREDLLRDKRRAVEVFFAFTGKHPGDVTPQDVKRWQGALAEKGLRPNTVYVRTSFLSSFYEWLMHDPALGRHIARNPVERARPRAPKAYQTESVKSLTDAELNALLAVVAERAAAGDVVGKRDYSLLLLFVATGMRRAEILSLRGRDLRLDDGLVITSRVKGGNYAGREVADPQVRRALLDYLSSAGRLHVLKSDAPVWTRHDRAGGPGEPLSSHCYVKNLKKYARAAGIDGFHLHRTRHTFARIVAEETGSIVETQDALNHSNPSTTRVYVQRIAVKRDRHGAVVMRRFAGAGARAADNQNKVSGERLPDDTGHDL